MERLNHFLKMDGSLDFHPTRKNFLKSYARRDARRVYFYIYPEEFFDGEVVEIRKNGELLLDPEEIQFLSEVGKMQVLRPGSYHIKCFERDELLLEFWFEITENTLVITEVKAIEEARDPEIFPGLVPSRMNIEFV